MRRRHLHLKKTQHNRNQRRHKHLRHMREKAKTTSQRHQWQFLLFQED